MYASLACMYRGGGLTPIFLRPTKEGCIGMKKTVLLLAMVATTLLIAGCSEPNAQGDEAEGQSPKKQQSSKQEKTVVVNEGMSKKEEEELQQRLDDLEK